MKHSIAEWTKIHMANADSFLNEYYKQGKIPEEIPKDIVEGVELSMRYTIGKMVVTYNWVRELAGMLEGKKCLQLHAHNGILTKALSDCGIDVIGTDAKVYEQINIFHEVENIPDIDAVEKYYNGRDIIVIAYPDIGYSENYKKLIKAINKAYEINPNTQVVFIGGTGICSTANCDFLDNFDDVELSPEMDDKLDLVNDLYHKNISALYQHVLFVTK